MRSNLFLAVAFHLSTMFPTTVRDHLRFSKLSRCIVRLRTIQEKQEKKYGIIGNKALESVDKKQAVESSSIEQVSIHFPLLDISILRDKSNRGR